MSLSAILAGTKGDHSVSLKYCDSSVKSANAFFTGTRKVFPRGIFVLCKSSLLQRPSTNKFAKRNKSTLIGYFVMLWSDLG